MKKKNSIFNNLLLLVVAFSVPATLFILKSENLDFRFSALDSNVPTHVVVSDIKGDSFKVNWVTEKSLIGGVKLKGETGLPLLEQNESSYHEITLTNLSPNVTYEFIIYSEGIEFLDDVKYYSATTATSIFPELNNFFVYGQVFSADGLTFQQGGQITLQLKRENAASQILATKINEAGGFQFNLNSLANAGLDNYYSYSGDNDVVLSVYTNNDENVTIKTYTINLDYTKQLPNFYLGDANVDEMPGIAY